jgi:hypothetical protein
MLFLGTEERLSGAEDMREYWQVWNFRGRLVDLYLLLSVQVLTRAVFIANEKRLTNWMKEKKSHILWFWPNLTTCKCVMFASRTNFINEKLSQPKIDPVVIESHWLVLIPCLTQFSNVFLIIFQLSWFVKIKNIKNIILIYFQLIKKIIHFKKLFLFIRCYMF